jgi:glutamate N-acetyltransferase/amino-acid N-acetyltransferase
MSYPRVLEQGPGIFPISISRSETNETMSIKTEGGITAPKGYLAAGAHIGIKKRRTDLALIWSEVPASVAATFTTNVVKAAPIVWNQKVVKEGKLIRGIVINSGNANACTGESGLLNAQNMAETFAQCKGVEPTEVLVSSTGLIGVPLPMERIKTGIEATHAQLSKGPVAATAAATAIITTDSCIKQIAVKLEIGGKTVTIGGMAKGSGMIHPNMATMLAFITTDAKIDGLLLQDCLNESISRTYNMISVDGDTSTNDMVVMLANGLAANEPIAKGDDNYRIFLDALNQVNVYLAKSIVGDGEGATKFIEVTVSAASTLVDAQKVARCIVSSNLVKAALFGNDPNWGWIFAAMGYSGVPFDQNKVSICFQSKAGKVCATELGEAMEFDRDFAKDILKEREICIHVQLNEGSEAATAWGCDLSYEYVRINGSLSQTHPTPPLTDNLALA